MTTTYSINRDQIISLALRKLGVLELGDTPDPATIANASISLNMMIKQWSTEGIKLWTTDEYTLPLVASQTSYTIGPSGANLTADRPLKLIQAWLRNTSVTPNVDTPLTILSKQEYNWLGSKATTGQANSIYLFPTTTYSTLYVYLTPTSTVATNYSLRFVARSLISDLTNPGDTPDFPSEWMQSLVWGLADQLAIEYSVPANHRIEIATKALLYKTQMEDWDVEAESTFFIPDMRMGARG